MKKKFVFLIFLISVILIGLINYHTYVFAEPGDTSRVSVASDGTQSNGESGYYTSISSDGRFIAFSSSASNLISGDTNEAWDIFVHDFELSKTTRVNVSSGGIQSEGEPFNYSRMSISADGGFVAFGTRASDIVSGDSNGTGDIFIHNLDSLETVRVSEATDGTQANSISYSPSISASGRYVAFVSVASNLVDGDTNGVVDIFLHDTHTHETIKISNDSNMVGNEFRDPSISADGLFISYESISYPHTASGIYVYNRDTGETSLIVVASEEDINVTSYDPDISSDGRYVAFQSAASNLVTNDTNECVDIFVFDTMTDEITRVSLTSDGVQADGASWNSSISSNGRYVAFESVADNLLGFNNYVNNIFVHDREMGETKRASHSYDANWVNADSGHPSISADGQHIAFWSRASNLVLGDTNGNEDIFLHETSDVTSEYSWLLMYYQAGDNNLDKHLKFEIVDIASTNNPNIEIAIFHDSSSVPAAYRFIDRSGQLITENKGQVNSGDGTTLVNFTNWAKSKSTATHFALIISDHGHALTGVANDASEYNDKITVDDELPAALAQIGPFDVLYMNTCLMANLELMYQIRGITDYYVAHESIGWSPAPHSNYIEEITTTTSPRDLAVAMASEYFNTISKIKYEDSIHATPSTISVADMTYLETVATKTQALASAINSAPLSDKTTIWYIIAGSESNVQRFNESFSRNINRWDRFVDLYHMAEILQFIPNVQAEAEALLATQSDFIIYSESWNGYPKPRDFDIYWDHQNANGVTIAFPVFPISFYKGTWLEFSEGADWSFWTGIASNVLTEDRSGNYWGPMVSNMIREFNPEGENQPEPPDLIAPGSILEQMYIPMIVQ